MILAKERRSEGIFFGFIAHSGSIVTKIRKAADTTHIFAVIHQATGRLCFVGRGILCFFLFFFLLCFLFPFSTCAQAAEMSPLLELGWQLHCAENADEARRYVQQLYSTPLTEYGLPAENLKFGAENRLFAGTLDGVLYVLYNTQRRYPELRLLVERTVLKWNYCRMFYKQWILDLMTKDGKVTRRIAARPFPLGSRGFSYWGFLDNDPEDRLVPLLLSDPPLGHRHFQYFFHRIYRRHCFPHPDTGIRCYEETPSPLELFGSEQAPFQNQAASVYPFSWNPKCKQEEIEEVREEPIDILPAPPPEEKIPVVPPPPPIEEEIVVPEPSPPRPVAVQPVTPEKPQPEKRVTDRLKNLELPTADERPLIGGSMPTPLPEKDSLGITGNFYYRKRLEGEPSIGASVAWAPAPYWFIRTGFDYQYNLNDKPFSYSWGIGYDDWHPGTVSVQLNNWGPILPGEDLKFDGSTLNIAYKFKIDALKKFHISGSAGIDFPMEGNGTEIVYTTWQWEPVNTWFIRVGIQYPLDGTGNFRWSYNFGRWDWHPFTVALTYDNWGINEFPHHNFEKNGAVNLSFSWAF